MSQFPYSAADFSMAMYMESRASIRYPEDCDRIREVTARLGIPLTRLQAYEFWEAYSESLCAQWLIIRSDEQIEEALRDFIAERLGDDE